MAKNVCLCIGQPETDSIDGKKPQLFFIPKVICLNCLADINFCYYSRQSLLSLQNQEEFQENLSVSGLSNTYLRVLVMDLG